MRNECHFNSSSCWYIHGKKNYNETNSRESMHEETANKGHENNRAEPEPSVFCDPPANLAPPSANPVQATWVKMMAMMNELNKMMKTVKESNSFLF